jgi:DNA-binding protein WhiA
VKFSSQVREELASLHPEAVAARRALLAALLRFAGTLRIGGTIGPRSSLVVTTESGAVARLVFQLLADHGARPDLRQRSPGGLRPRTAYEVVLDERVERVLHATGIMNRAGALTAGIPATLVRSREAAACYARGAWLSRGSVSQPARDAHLEVTAPSERACNDLAKLLTRLGLPAAAFSQSADGKRPWRVVVKGGEAIGNALLTFGAHDAYLAWADGRIRREVRAEAVRLANADEANLRRSVAAAVAQAGAIERVVERIGWDELPADLADVARLRLDHPQATLAELGAMLDPPRSKSTVLGRLRRLVTLADDVGGHDDN